LIKVLVVYQMIGTEKLSGLIRTLTEHAGLQAALGGTVALNTLSNGVRERDVGQMVEAWPPYLVGSVKNWNRMITISIVVIEIRCESVSVKHVKILAKRHDHKATTVSAVRSFLESAINRISVDTSLAGHETWIHKIL
jgi:hypothetical protein